MLNCFFKVTVERKKIMLKKIMCYSMIAVIICCCIAGCNSTGGSSSSDFSSTVENNKPDPLAVDTEERKQVDLQGKEFTIVTFDHTLFSWTEGESDYGDAVLQRIADVEAELNCSLNFKIMDTGTMATELAAAQLSGDKFADVITPILHSTASFISGGMLMDMNEIPNLDLTKSYWNKDDGTAFGKIGDKQYFAVCPMVQAEEYAWSIAFNKRILAECNLESPYDLMNRNEWTLSKMREMAKAATKETNGIEGMTAEDQWGIAAVDKVGIFGLAIMSAKNAHFITKNSSGDLLYALNTAPVKDAISYTRDWLNNDNTIFSGTYEETKDVWALGHALFYSYMFKDVKEYSKTMEDDYGLVPFPRADESDDYAMALEWNRAVLAVPSGLSDEDINDVGLLLDSLAYHSQKEYAAKWNEYKERYTCDDQSIEIIDTLFDYTTYDYSQLIAGSGNEALYNSSYQVYFNLMQQPNLSITDQIAAVTDAGKQSLLTWLSMVE